jgi:hypothetical protein
MQDQEFVGASGPDKIGSELWLENMKRRVRWAAEISDEAGDLREIAFSKVLDGLFGLTAVDATAAVTPSVAAETPRDQTRSRSGTGATRKVPKTDPSDLARIQPLLGASPETTADLVSRLTGLPAKLQVFGCIDLASEKFGIKGLTTAEIRETLRQSLRIGMPDGTLRGILSKASPAELGRIPNSDGETEYQLMRGGKELLANAIASLSDSD